MIRQRPALAFRVAAFLVIAHCVGGSADVFVSKRWLLAFRLCMLEAAKGPVFLYYLRCYAHMRLSILVTARSRCAWS